MNEVEAACTRDVATLCPMPSDFLLSDRHDPSLDFIINPMVPGPIIMDTSFLDDMMNSALRMSLEQPMGTTWTIYYDAGAGSEEKPAELSLPNHVISLPQVPTTPENVMDSMLSSLAQVQQESSSETWNPVLFSKRLSDHGHSILSSQMDSTNERRSLARRLSETTPTRFTTSRLPLPFGCPKNRCLMSAFEQGAVSNACNNALTFAEQLNVSPRSYAVPVEQYQYPDVVSYIIIYVLLALTILVIAHHRLGKFHQNSMERRRLKWKIMQAVYSNKELKASVEFQLQQEIGNVPPLPPHALASMGGMKLHSGCKISKITFLAFLVFAFFFSPLLLIPIICMMMMARSHHWSFCPSKTHVRLCCCCCCGVSTEDVKNSTVSSEQACCTCCDGLGVCGPCCTSCCGSDPEYSSCCCSESCDCCNPQPKCTCCCCGLTNWDARKGIMTDEQACCTCCGSTGKHHGCADCCGGSSPDSKVAVYQGVPIQVV